MIKKEGSKYMLVKNNKLGSSKDQIGIKSVDYDTLEIEGNELRAILELSSINFELKSEKERDSIIEIYKNLLNSLPCPIQILVKIRALDIDKYIDDFKNKNQTTNIVLKAQINDYQDFVKNLVKRNKILTRKFYVVIPLTKLTAKQSESKEQLNLYCDILSKSFGNLGIQVRRLNNLEIFDLFYSFYNQESFKTQPIIHETFKLINQAII